MIRRTTKLVALLLMSSSLVFGQTIKTSNAVVATPTKVKTEGVKISKPIVTSGKDRIFKANQLDLSKNGQNTKFKGDRCGTGHIHNNLYQNNPDYRAAYDAAKAENQKVKDKWNSGQKAPATVYTIPVVFHVIHKGEAVGTGTNISDAQVASAIDAMNRDWRRTADDGGVAQGAGPDMEVEFCLAVRDPSGNPTSGINRVSGTSVSGYSTSGITSATDENVKALSKWDNTKYLNIWVVSEIEGEGDDPNTWGGGTMGYAYLPINPVSAMSAYDGIVAVHFAVGNDPDGTLGYRLVDNTTWLGRTLTHEAGHWMGMAHPFDDGNPSTCTDGDGYTDTPDAKQYSGFADCSPTVPSGAAICTGQMYQNYMDYFDERCYSQFTTEQKTDARATLTSLRSGILTSQGCTPVYSLDAAIAAVIDPNGTFCGSDVVPTVTLRNNGSTTLTSATITYNIDGGSNQTYNWTGSLTSSSEEDVTLSSMTTTAGAHTFNVTVSSPNGGADQYSANNSMNSSFTLQLGNEVNFTLTSDGYASEVSYTLVQDATSTTIDQLSAGTLADACPTGPEINESYCLADGCYTLTINDAFSDGLSYTTSCGSVGDYIVTDGTGATLAQIVGGANYGAQAIHNFCVSPPAAGDDAQISGIVAPANGSTVCSTTIDGEVTLRNNGSNTLTDVDIIYGVDGDYSNTFSWTGTLSSGSSTVVSLTSITVTAGAHTFNVSTTSPNGVVDVDPSNDDASSSFTAGGTMVTFSLTTDQYGSETTWEIVTSPGAVQMASGGPYGPDLGGAGVTTQTPVDVCLADGCYDLIVTDSYGDGINSGYGAGFYTLEDASANSLASGWNTPSGPANTPIDETSNFCLPFAATPPTANFEANDQNVPTNGTVIFTDLTTANPAVTDWAWSFGDGGTSTNQNPSYTYTTPGVYSVTLTATNSAGSDDEIKTFFITVFDPMGVCDTIDNILAADNFYEYPYDYGYLAGHNDVIIDNVPTGANMTKFADKQYAAANTTLRGLLVPIANIDNNSGTGTVTFTVYSDNAGEPSAAAVRSEVRNLADLTEASWNYIELASPYALTAGTNFYVGYEITYGSPLDTFAVYMAVDRTGTSTRNSGFFYANLGGGLNWYDYDATFGGFKTSILIRSLTSTGVTTPSFTISDNTVCDGTTVNFNASASTNTLEYYWDFDGDSNLDDAVSVSSYAYPAAGVYDATLYTVGGCFTDVSIQSVTVSEGATLSTSVTNVLCNGGSTGSINLTPTGGITNYTYLWSNASTTQDPSGLSVGNYTVTVTDAYGCTAATSASITAPTALSLTVTSTDVTVNGGNDGTATATVSGGTAPYAYFWNPGGLTASTENNLTAGAYCVTVTDNNGCTIANCTTISEPAALSVTVGTTAENCGDGTGTATATVTGTATPYTYAWSNGSTANPAISLNAGTYTVTVTDNNGSSTTASGVVSNNTGTLALSTTPTNETCSNATGTVVASPSGGTAGYTYLWSNGKTTATITGLSSATYTVTVTDGAGCKKSSSSVVSNNPNTLAVTVTATDENCGGADGTATSIVTGGLTNYSYLWSNSATTSSLSSLSSATYTLTVTDANGCTATASDVVSNNTGTLAVAPTSTQETCIAANGTATANASGGQTPYTYAWSNTSTASSISGLSQGNYTVTVTDNLGCKASSSVSVTRNNGTIAATASSTDAFCGNTNGTASVSASSGTSPYFYLWSNAGTTASIINIASGAYSVTVADMSGCTTTASTTVAANAGNLAVSATSTAETCTSANGTATANITGGVTAYSYLWSEGSTTATANGLSQGSYNVTVTDGYGCTSSTSVSITRNNGSIAASVTTTEEVCGDGTGTATAVVTGNSGALTYVWSNSNTNASISALSAATYSVSVTDAAGCTANASGAVANGSGTLTVSVTSTNENCGLANGTATATAAGNTGAVSYLWSNAATDAAISGLAASTYTVTISDAASCSTTGVVTITNSAGLSVTVATNGTCPGSSAGDATASVSGASGAVTYIWSNGGTGAFISGLASAMYTVTATDAMGCSDVASNSVNFLASPNHTATSTAASCNGGTDGTATVTPGGTDVTPFSYSWSNSATDASISGLSTGDYTVTITDGNGCTASETVNVGQATAVSLVMSTTPENCGAGNGTATATASGGNSVYAYLWSNGGSTATISSLSEATYSVTVSDGNLCTATSSIVVSNSTSSLTASTSSVAANCLNGADGSASVVASNGQTPYTYAWSNGASVSAISGLTAGNYTVTVSDAFGCVTTTSANVSQPATGMTLVVTSDDATCGDANGLASAGAFGGAGGYTYNWSNGESTAALSGLTAGVYTTTVTDNSGCTASSSITISDLGVFTASITPATATICEGENLTLTASGGDSYIWSDFVSGASRIVNTGGVYTISVTNDIGCTEVVSANVTEITAPTTTVSASVNTICPGEVVTLTANGGDNYFWVHDNANTTDQAVVTPEPGNSIYTVFAYIGSCQGSAAQATITFYSPTPVADAVSNTVAIPVGGSVNFSLGANNEGNVFEWDFDGNGTIDATTGTASHTYSAAGLYDAVLHTSYSGAPCEETDTIVINVGDVSVQALGLSNSIKLYPNPTKDAVNVSFTLEREESVRIEVYNALGESVKFVENDKTRFGNYNIDLSTEADGLYFVQVRTETETSTFRVHLVK